MTPNVEDNTRAEKKLSFIGEMEDHLQKRKTALERRDHYEEHTI